MVVLFYLGGYILVCWSFSLDQILHNQISEVTNNKICPTLDGTLFLDNIHILNQLKNEDFEATRENLLQEYFQLRHSFVESIGIGIYKGICNEIFVANDYSCKICCRFVRETIILAKFIANWYLYFPCIFSLQICKKNFHLCKIRCNFITVIIMQFFIFFVELRGKSLSLQNLL